MWEKYLKWVKVSRNGFNHFRLLQG